MKKKPKIEKPVVYISDPLARQHPTLTRAEIPPPRLTGCAQRRPSPHGPRRAGGADPQGPATVLTDEGVEGKTVL